MYSIKVFIELFDEVLIDLISFRGVLTRTLSSYLSRLFIEPRFTIRNIGGCFKRSYFTDLRIGRVVRMMMIL